MNIATWLDRAALRDAETVAIARGEVPVMSYGTLARRVAGLATGLRRSHRLGSGDRVAIVASNHTAYIEALFAAWWAGMVAVPINSKLHRSEIAWILDNAQVGAIFVSSDLEVTVGETSYEAGPLLSFGDPDYEQLVELDPLPVVPRDPDDLGWLFYTSGTTGRPKGAMLTHRNLMTASVAHLAEVDPTCPGDVLIHAAPLSHASGMLSLGQICCGGVNVIPESGRFESDEVLSLANHWRRASLFAAPTMIRRLVDETVELERDAFRTIVWGGAPMHVADTVSALERFGPCLAQIYGQGESPMTIAALSKRDVGLTDHPDWTHRLASAGIPRTVVEVKVKVADDDSDPSSQGEILVRGDTVMAGYWNAPEASAETLRDGWLHTGDVGVFDEHGYLTLLDRTKDLIISGGSNIYPREVEEVLAAHPEVREVSVIGRPDPEWGEVVVAYVVGGAGRQALDDACLQGIARFKRPKDYVFVDSLPKSGYGKILKSDLRKLDAGRTASQTSSAETDPRSDG